jgi:putative transposase
MVRQRRRKKLPVPERQPLLRPSQPNEVWSMDFVFDELAPGRRVKTLTVVDDCTKESVQLVADTSIPALYVTRVLDQVKCERGLPKVIRTDNGPEFSGRTMHDWAARNGVELRFIQPGPPVQNAYIESFNSRLRDECLS